MKRGGPGQGVVRPVSWCTEVFRSPLKSSRHDAITDGSRCEGVTGQGRAGLARSTSYQALHSALARLYRIDDFTMDKIGQGFFSEVYKVRHRVTGDVMVLKMNKLVSNRHNMLREVELMNRLRHPHILSYYGVCVHEGQVHALTEYINGGSLDALLQNRAMEVPWCTRISLALDIARGMDYLHSQQVFHRDLTSKNVLIKYTQEGGKPKLSAVIADFGLAAPIPQDRCVRLRQVGSPYWMAPEVIRGDWYDHRVDVFSFGIIVCEMIARCEADPDVLPRTHTFGVHYLAFSKMCKDDCPPAFLQMAFQCCQIDPDARPSFWDLKIGLEKLLHCLTNHQAAPTGSRKHKVCHRRSLSDDKLILHRNQTPDGSGVNGTSGSPEGVGNAIGGTPREVLERMSAADPYFQPSTATVNPFAEVRIPARSQQVVQEGGRVCHSLPDAGSLLKLADMSAISASETLAASDSSLCPPAVVNSHHCHCRPSYTDRTTGDLNHKQCHCIVAKDSGVSDRGEAGCKYSFNSHTILGANLTAGTWQHHCRSIGQDDDGEGGSSASPRSDGSGGVGGSTPIAGHHLIGPVRRRGSGESGFFSVGDFERIGTPELCLSYSELSSASLVSTEDEDLGEHCIVQRSSSVITDSSEDLSSLGCCHDPHHCCELASLPDPDDANHPQDADYSKDIRSIVEFFERGYGSTHTSQDGFRKLSLNIQRKDCSVPQLRNKFNSSSSYSRLQSISSSITKQPWGTNNLMSVKSFSTKENSVPKSYRQPCSRSERRDTIRGKDRPKVYITEGTVRAKRNFFETK